MAWAVLPSYLMYIYEPYQLLCYFLASAGSVALYFALTCLFGIPKEVTSPEENDQIPALDHTIQCGFHYIKEKTAQQ